MGNKTRNVLITMCAGTVAFAAEIAKAQCECPNGWVQNEDNSHCYALTQADTWLRSEAEAVGLGGHLATVRNDDENQWLLNQFGQGGIGPWIGLFQQDGAPEPAGGWVWVSGEDAEYRNWNDGEPNDLNGGENWAHFYGATEGREPGKWNDLGLPFERTGIIERECRAGCRGGEFAKLLADDGGSTDAFGRTVAIRDDVALIGAWGDDDNGDTAGAAYVFRRHGTAWMQEAKLVAGDGFPDQLFGSAVAVDEDTALVGAMFDDTNGFRAGAAYVFRFDGENWMQEAKLLPARGTAGDEFGQTVSLSNGVALIGARYDGENGIDSGAAYVFRFDGENWIEERKLLASDGETGDRFGESVSLSGETALIGAVWDDDSGEKAGAAYVFRFDNGQWTQEEKLHAPDGTQGDYFGQSVSIEGDVTLVGAYGDDERGDESGAAYAFRYDGESWGRGDRLNAADGAAGDNFGQSVSLSGSVALIGAWADDDNGEQSGAAYAFRFDGKYWIESAKVLASEGTDGDAFGTAVAIYDGSGIVGAHLADEGEVDAGAAYYFTGLSDCQPNGTIDLCDIATGGSRDDNENGIPDECEGCNGERSNARCRGNNNGRNVIKAKLSRARPDEDVVFRLDGACPLMRHTNLRGKFTAKWKKCDGGRIQDGPHNVTAELAYGCEKAAETNCP